MIAKNKTKAKAEAQTETRVAGKQYRVLGRGAYYPTNPKAIKRIQAGEKVPFEERGMVDARPGTIITDVPAAAVESLLAQGLVEPYLPAGREVNDDAKG